MTTVIETSNISVHYSNSEAITDISFRIESGDFVGLAGPNGAGKTTLVKAILGLVPLSKGHIELLGQTQKSFRAWDKIGYLPQKASTINPLFPATVDEIVMLGLISKRTYPKRISKNDKERTDAVLRELGIHKLKKKMFSELSGGQQQKVLLARALVSKPEVLIFDEPSTALDPESRESFFKMLERLNKEIGITILFITHDTGYIGQYANKLMYIDKSLIYYGKFSDFCKSEKMNEYFGTYEHHVICHQHTKT
jgi:zinc transport system ATP-binding protein